MVPFNNTQVAAGMPSQLSKTTPLEQAGLVIHKTKGMLKAIFDVALQTGGTAPAAAYSLVDDLGNAAVLPAGAYVTNVVAVGITSFVGTSATIALGFLTASDLMAATAIASLTAATVAAGTPVGTAATWKGPATSTVQDPYSPALGVQVKATVATTTLTAGKIAYFIEYVIL